MNQPKPDLKTTSGKLQDLRNRLTEASAPLGEEAVEAVTAAGQMTARQRVAALLDEGSFEETDALARHRATEFTMERTQPATDGVVTGYGLVDGRRVCVYSQDATIFDGALGEVYAEKILKLYDLAMKTGVPIVGIIDGGGTRTAEGLVTLSFFAKLLAAVSEASGVVPQIAVVARAEGLHATLVELADIIVGASAHAHLPAESDAAALAATRELLGLLPVNNMAEAPRVGVDKKEVVTDLDTIIPDDGGHYDVRALIAELIDAPLLELTSHEHSPVITGLARIDGRAVGLVANQPGCALTDQAASQVARFLRTCDTFNLPIVQLVDLAEVDAGPHSAAQLVYANAEASVGKITVITRQAYGAGYVLMGAKDTGADLVYAWPTAEIALASAESVATELDTDASAYAAEHLTPYRAAERGLVDAVIEPSATRAKLGVGLGLVERKVVHPRPKKHGNIPL